jgi:HTH-type transcriptional regulator/antitoxin HigA
MKTKATGNAQDTYLRLIYRFPLRPIRTDGELDQAIQVIDSLIDREHLDPGEQDYLDVLSDLVHHYETEVHPIPAVSDAQMLNHLIESKGVSQAQVARETGIASSTISEILSGHRHLNRGQIAKLCAYFKVGPGVFISVAE